MAAFGWIVQVEVGDSAEGQVVRLLPGSWGPQSFLSPVLPQFPHQANVEEKLLLQLTCVQRGEEGCLSVRPSVSRQTLGAY